MSLWRKALSGSVRYAGRTVGRTLSRHVIPDSITPWQTRKIASSTVSGIWGFGSRLVKKQARKISNQRQASKSRSALVAKDREQAQLRAKTPYKSPALSRVLRPTQTAAPSFWKRIASPWQGAQRTVTASNSPARPARSTATPKKPGRLYVDTETGELFDRPGSGRTWADAPRPASKSSPSAWQRGDKLKASKEEIQPYGMNAARAHYMSGPASIRSKGKKHKPQTGNNSYSPNAERRSKFAY